jgi:hypothetical protein
LYTITVYLIDSGVTKIRRLGVVFGDISYSEYSRATVSSVFKNGIFIEELIIGFDFPGRR